jgi:hypothetical protein
MSNVVPACGLLPQVAADYPARQGVACLSCDACHSATWESEQTLTKNYAANKLLADANKGFGRNKSAEPLKTSDERHAAGEGTLSDDDGEDFC